MATKKDNTDKYDWKITVTKKGKKYDTDKYQGHTEGPWYRMHSNDTIRSEPMGDNAEAHLFDIVGATTVDAELAADAPLLLEEIKRYYGFVDELLNYFHHTTLENESFMDLMYRMGIFEFEPEPWQNEKGEWMIFVGDTYETGEWVVDKDLTKR